MKEDTEIIQRGSLDDARSGDLLAVRASEFSLFSWLIQLRTLSNINHVVCCGRNATIVEALSRGVMRDSIYAYDRSWWFLLRPNLGTRTPAQLDSMNEFLRQQIGKGYDWRGILGFDFLFGKNREDPDRWFCSELARAWYEAGGFRPVRRLPRGLTSPQALIEWDDLDVVAYRWPKQLEDYLE